MASQIDRRPSLPLSSGQQSICSGGRQSGNLAMVREAQNFAAPRTFESPSHRREVGQRLKFPAKEALSGNLGPLTIAMVAEGPPIADVPIERLVREAQLTTNRYPVVKA